jgi:hypothetical protein
LGGIGRLLRGDAARESRRSAGINRAGILQGFRPLRTGTLQTRILADPKKPRRSAASGVVHGRLSRSYNLRGHTPKEITVGNEVGLVLMNHLLFELPLHTLLQEGSSPEAFL